MNGNSKIIILLSVVNIIPLVLLLIGLYCITHYDKGTELYGLGIFIIIMFGFCLFVGISYLLSSIKDKINEKYKEKNEMKIRQYKIKRIINKCQKDSYLKMV